MDRRALCVDRETLVVGHGDDGGLGIQGVEDCFDDEEINAAFDQ